MNKMVRFCSYFIRSSALFMTFRKSSFPLSTPLRTSKYDCVCSAIRFAKLVLPTPGGPQNIIEESSSYSMSLRNNFPLPIICSCPTNSSKFLGRILSARGSVLFIFFILNQTKIYTFLWRYALSTYAIGLFSPMQYYQMALHHVSNVQVCV